MKATIGIMMLTCSVGANAQSNGKTVDDIQAKSLPEVAIKRMTLLSVMELACIAQQNQGEQRMNTADECKIISMANSSTCLEKTVCEPIDGQIKQYIQSVKTSPASK